jgi:hypothetical protein
VNVVLQMKIVKDFTLIPQVEKKSRSVAAHIRVKVCRYGRLAKKIIGKGEKYNESYSRKSS